MPCEYFYIFPFSKMNNEIRHFICWGLLWIWFLSGICDCRVKCNSWQKYMDWIFPLINLVSESWCLKCKHNSYNVNFSTGNQISTEDSPDSKSLHGIQECSLEEELLLVPISLVRSAGFSSISSSPAASLSPATLHH